MKDTFKIGDKVRVINSFYEAKYNLVGYITKVLKNNEYEVDFKQFGTDVLSYCEIELIKE